MASIVSRNASSSPSLAMSGAENDRSESRLYDSIGLKIDGMYKMSMSSGLSGRKGIY